MMTSNLHFNRMHRWQNLLLGWCYADVGIKRDGYFAGPTYVAININSTMRAVITDVRVEIR